MSSKDKSKSAKGMGSKISEIICDTNLCEKLVYQNNELLKNYLINTKTASKTISNFLNNLEQTCNT